MLLWELRTKLRFGAVVENVFGRKLARGVRLAYTDNSSGVGFELWLNYACVYIVVNDGVTSVKRRRRMMVLSAELLNVICPLDCVGTHGNFFIYRSSSRLEHDRSAHVAERFFNKSIWLRSPNYHLRSSKNIIENENGRAWLYYLSLLVVRSNRVKDKWPSILHVNFLV